MIEEKERPPLVLVGDRREPGEKEVLRRLAEEKRVQVTLLEGLSDSELVEHYNRASLVVYAPYLEPFGFVPLEAMACGTPVVGVREGGVRESVVHGETGLLVERDVEAFAEATRELLRDEPRRAAFGQAGSRLVRERWTWEESTKRLLALLQKTMDKGRGTA